MAFKNGQCSIVVPRLYKMHGHAPAQFGTKSLKSAIVEKISFPL